jgi:nicotinamide mononucleotide transporter
VLTPLELAANAVMTASIVLAGRNSVHTWWTGIVGCALFGLVFLQANLYADVALQGFFIATSALGWWQWLRGDHGRALAVTRAPLATLAGATLAGLLATWGYGTLLHRYTDAYAPFADSAVLAFSVIAQVLLMQRRLEAWAFWWVVNTIAVPLYATRGLHLTAVLYAAYWVNAVVAWRHWQAVAGPRPALRAGDEAA